MFGASIVGTNASALTTAASVDIAANVVSNELEFLSPGDDVKFTYTALEELLITGISLSATAALEAFADPLATVQFGFAFPATEDFSMIVPSGTTAAGLGNLEPADIPFSGASMVAGDMFDIFVSNNSAENVVMTVTVATAPVPLPASVLLMLAGLGALPIVSRRKRLAA